MQNRYSSAAIALLFLPNTTWRVRCTGCFRSVAVGYRGAALALENAGFLMAAAYGLVVAQAPQSPLLGGWIAGCTPQTAAAVLRAWRPSRAG